MKGYICLNLDNLTDTQLISKLSVILKVADTKFKQTYTPIPLIKNAYAICYLAELCRE